MHSISTHRARILPGASTNEDAPTRRTPAGQAALFKLHRDALRHAAAQEDAHEPEDTLPASDEQSASQQDEPPRDDAHDGDSSQQQSGDERNAEPSAAAPGSTAHGATSAGVAATAVKPTAPSQAALAAVQHNQTFAWVSDFIVAQVADFCSDPAVLVGGEWRLSLTIDPALLPGCTLHLSLSHFTLTLRFDTSDDQSANLILQHAGSLKTRLADVLDSRRVSRTIEIIVN